MSNFDESTFYTFLGATVRTDNGDIEQLPAEKKKRKSSLASESISMDLKMTLTLTLRLCRLGKKSWETLPHSLTVWLRELCYLVERPAR